MLKFKALLTLVAAFTLVAVTASSASALSIAGGPTFRGVQSTNQVFRIGNALTTTCTTARADGVTNVPPQRGVVAPNTLGTPSTNMARFRMTYTGCTTAITGLSYPTTVTVNCDWLLAPSTYNAATGTSTGVLRTGVSGCTGGTVIALSGSPCTVTVPDQLLSTGATGQNVTAANQPSPANGAPVGMRIVANIVNGISYTSSGCPGVPAAAPPGAPLAGYTGTIVILPTTGPPAAPGVWVVP